MNHSIQFFFFIPVFYRWLSRVRAPCVPIWWRAHSTCLNEEKKPSFPPKAPHIGFFQVWPSSLPSPLPSARCPLFPQTSVSIFNAVEFFKKRNFQSDVSVVALCFKPLSCLGIVSKLLLTVCYEFCVRQKWQQWPSKTNQQPRCQNKGLSLRIVGPEFLPSIATTFNNRSLSVSR